jgi:hypothetical protein
MRDDGWQMIVVRWPAPLFPLSLLLMASLILFVSLPNDVPVPGLPVKISFSYASSSLSEGYFLERRLDSFLNLSTGITLKHFQKVLNCHCLSSSIYASIMVFFQTSLPKPQ